MNEIAIVEDSKEFLKKIAYNIRYGRSVYASILLIGNITGKYVFNDFYHESVKGLNIDAFSKENQELLSELKSHFVEYVMNNNKRKNVFAERIQVEKLSIKDLSQDINETELVEDFDRVLNGDETNDNYFKPKIIVEYLMKTIGTYYKKSRKI